MKFQVRDGFVCTRAVRVEVGGGQSEVRESETYAGQTVELTPDEAAQHAHKLEPRDDEAAAWMRLQEFVSSARLDAQAFGLSDAQLAVITQQVLEAHARAAAARLK